MADRPYAPLHIHRAIERPVRDHFVCFSRNGVWGTCVDCPRDVDHNVYPEFCQNFNRYDHCLSLADLVHSYDSHFNTTAKELARVESLRNPP